MSNIVTAYGAIAAYAPTGVTTSRNISAAQLAVADADLPCRILLPATEADGEFVAIGDLQGVNWTIKDLCLWAPLEAGTGVQQYSAAMLTYITSYLSKVKAGRSPAANCTIVGFAFNMAPVKWGVKDYWAVDISLIVREIL